MARKGSKLDQPFARSEISLGALSLEQASSGDIFAKWDKKRKVGEAVYVIGSNGLVRSIGPETPSSNPQEHTLVYPGETIVRVSLNEKRRFSPLKFKFSTSFHAQMEVFSLKVVEKGCNRTYILEKKTDSALNARLNAQLLFLTAKSVAQRLRQEKRIILGRNNNSYCAVSIRKGEHDDVQVFYEEVLEKKKDQAVIYFDARSLIPVYIYNAGSKEIFVNGVPISENRFSQLLDGYDALTMGGTTYLCETSVEIDPLIDMSSKSPRDLFLKQSPGSRSRIIADKKFVDLKGAQVSFFAPLALNKNERIELPGGVVGGEETKVVTVGGSADTVDTGIEGHFRALVFFCQGGKVVVSNWAHRKTGIKSDFYFDEDCVSPMGTDRLKLSIGGWCWYKDSRGLVVGFSLNNDGKLILKRK